MTPGREEGPGHSLSLGEGHTGVPVTKPEHFFSILQEDAVNCLKRRMQEAALSHLFSSYMVPFPKALIL